MVSIQKPVKTLGLVEKMRAEFEMKHESKVKYEHETKMQDNLARVESRNSSGFGTYQVSALEPEPMRVALEHVRRGFSNRK